MKTLKVICIELVLALSLSVSAHAGDVSSPGMTAPTPIPLPKTEMSESNRIEASDPGYPTGSVLDSAELMQLLVALMF
ncbi:MAG TPA: hypothetical protein VJV03_17105 [Pyrinomonadaceae bacterium]|nr:hypothetical protein [Pyrinomonadaceae bacterium]